MALQDFNFKIPQNIIYGKGSLKKLPEILKEAKCDKVLLVSDRGLKGVGLVDKVADIIKASGIECHEFLDLQPNPTIPNVHSALDTYKAVGATSIIALGGGGPMDVAKSVALLATYGGEVTDYAGFGKVPGPVVPMIAIPTTAGTGSEVTASSVITDPVSNFKMAVIDYNLIPEFALLDPELIMTLPASIAAACGVDAFVHAEEAYVSTAANPMTDAFAEKAMELLGKYIRRFVARRDDEEAACNMMLGSTLAGVAFAWAKLGNVHAMSHPVSGFFGVAHGIANAVLFPNIVEYNALADKEDRYRRIYNYITEGKKADDSFVPSMLADELRKLNKQLGIPATLTEVGVSEDKLPNMVADAMKSGNVLVNPRQTGPKEIEMLYRKTM